MKVYGLIGLPLSHSFSKKYFTEKFLSEGISHSFEYENFELQSIAEFPELISKNSNLSGLNVTAPYKSAVIPFLDELVGAAADINAVNTIKINRNENGSSSRLTGYNTDVTGFRNTLEPLLKPHHTGALVLGTGGASKAVLWVLEQLGLPFKIVSRKKADGMMVYSDITSSVINNFPIIINTTPVGTHPNVDDAPEIPYELLIDKNLLYDLVYNPEETSFLRKGKEKGATGKNGLQMLQIQAEEAWKIWNV